MGKGDTFLLTHAYVLPQQTSLPKQLLFCFHPDSYFFTANRRCSPNVRMSLKSRPLRPQVLRFALPPRVLNSLPEAKRTRQHPATEFLVSL